MINSFCGRVMGHGESCSPGYLCDQCIKVDRLERENQSLKEQLAEVRGQLEWRPIETAPTETPILIYRLTHFGECYEVAEISHDRSWQVNPDGAWWNLKATHWRPLRKPPAASLPPSKQP